MGLCAGGDCARSTKNQQIVMQILFWQKLLGIGHQAIACVIRAVCTVREIDVYNESIPKIFVGGQMSVV